MNICCALDRKIEKNRKKDARHIHTQHLTKSHTIFSSLWKNCTWMKLKRKWNGIFFVFSFICVVVGLIQLWLYLFRIEFIMFHSTSLYAACCFIITIITINIVFLYSSEFQGCWLWGSLNDDKRLNHYKTFYKLEYVLK